jgi:hypothetical protein
MVIQEELPRVFQLCSLSSQSGTEFGRRMRYWDDAFAMIAMRVRAAGCTGRKGATMKAFAM